VFLIDTPYSGGGSAQFLEVRHRGHACVGDHIRCGKTTGFGRFPSCGFAVNAVWLELSLTAIDLLVWMRVLLLEASSRMPSRRSSATGCCTSPPVSPAAAAACACGYPRPGPGETNSPQPSTASPHCPVPLADRQALPATTRKTLEDPTNAPGFRHARTPKTPRSPNSWPSETPHRPNRNGEASCQFVVEVTNWGVLLRGGL
jgi:hypothetical protein